MSRLSEALKDTIDSGSTQPRRRPLADSTSFSSPAVPSTPTRRRNSAPSSLETLVQEIQAAGALIRVEFDNEVNALVLRVVAPVRRLGNTPPLTRGILPELIELGRLSLLVTEGQGHEGTGYYSLRVRPEMVALERQLARVEVPEIMIAGVASLSDLALLENDGFAREVVTFGSLTCLNQMAVRRWCERYGSGRPNLRSDTVEIARTAPLARSRETAALLREMGILQRSTEGNTVVEWILTREIRRFRAYIEEHPLYEQAINFLQRFQQLFNESASETTTHNNIRASSNQEVVGGRIWVRFDIEGTIDRPTHTYTRTRARTGALTVPNNSPYRDVRNRLTRIDWQLAQELFFRAFPALSVITINRTDASGRTTTVTTISNIQTPASRAAGRLAQFGLTTPPSPTNDLPSPTQVSFYADTDCRSSQTPSEYAAYRARHASAARQWPEAVRASCREEREPSPGLSHYSDQNGIHEADWPVFGGGHGIASILSGHPGGIDGEYLRSVVGIPMTRGGELKRRLTAASFRSSTPRKSDKKRMRRFPTPEPFDRNSRVLQEIEVERGSDDEEEDGGDEGGMEWGRLNEREDGMFGGEGGGGEGGDGESGEDDSEMT
ncbi:hypothetical protein TWF281_009764 [Arthrobotrys megalospora]